MAKKDFKGTNPALAFISEEVQEEPQEERQDKPTQTGRTKKDIPEGYKLNPEYIEVKGKRVQLLLQPSTVDAIKALAKKKGLSMNETINEAIQAYLQNEN